MEKYTRARAMISPGTAWITNVPRSSIAVDRRGCRTASRATGRARMVDTAPAAAA
jgi:hypothetical protein